VDERRAVRFPRADLGEQLAAFAARWPAAAADRRGFAFAAPDGTRLRVPLAGPRLSPGEAAGDYLARLPGPSERQAVLLLQAGAAAIGYWDGDELVDHVAIRKYVVRGSGKAQGKHLRTRGKSRYGSRLRLQNWRRLLVAVNERLHSCWERFGAPERIFCGATVRTLGDLFAADPPPPFPRDAANLQRLPVHVHVPDFAELRTVRYWLEHGELELARA